MAWFGIMWSLIHDYLIMILVGYEDGYGGRPTRNLAEQATNSSVLLLAPEETTRKDPLNDFEPYTGGWNITSKHYWAVSNREPLYLITRCDSNLLYSLLTYKYHVLLSCCV